MDRLKRMPVIHLAGTTVSLSRCWGRSVLEPAYSGPLAPYASPCIFLESASLRVFLDSLVSPIRCIQP